MFYIKSAAFKKNKNGKIKKSVCTTSKQYHDNKKQDMFHSHKIIKFMYF